MADFYIFVLILVAFIAFMYFIKNQECCCYERETYYSNLDENV